MKQKVNGDFINQDKKSKVSMEVTKAEQLLLTRIRMIDDIDELVEISNGIEEEHIKNCILNIAAEKLL